MSYPLTAFWLHRVPSWLRAVIISAAQSAGAAILLTVLGVIDDLAKAQTVDWTAVIGDARVQLLLAAQAVVTAIHRHIRPPETSYTKES